jgi:hypothetical protein
MRMPPPASIVHHLMRSSLFILGLFKEDKDRDSRRQQDAYLRLTRRRDASPERVFDALVNLETIRTWRSPSRRRNSKRSPRRLEPPDIWG